MLNNYQGKYIEFHKIANGSATFGERRRATTQASQSTSAAAYVHV